MRQKRNTGEYNPPVHIHKRKRIPLSTRVAVLKRQCPPEKVAEIERNGGTLKDKYAKLLLHAKCALSGNELKLTGVQWDHEIPLALGGTNDPENIQAVAPKPHREKTDRDDADIARATRRANYAETGRGRKRKGRPLKSRGFDTRLKKKMDGTVVERGE